MQPARRIEPAEYGWLAAAVLAPLVLNPAGCSVFELPKAAIVQGCALAAWAPVLVAPRGAGRRSPLVWPLLALAAAAVLATLTSIDRGLSLWGSLDRQQGLLTLLAYVALAAAVALRLRTRDQALRLLRALLWGSAFVVVYGLAQALGLDPVPWQTDAASRVLSTAGRANFLGSYLVLVFPLTIVAARLATRRWPVWLLLAGQFAVLAATSARAAWVGAAAAGVTLLVCWAAAVRRRQLAVVGLTGVLLALVLVLNLAPALSPALQRVPGASRVASLTDTGSGSNAARLTIWRAVLPLIASRPWTGYGPETTEAAFAPVFPPQLVYYQGRDAIVDRAHNVWLDQALGTGLPGVVALMALFGIAGWQGMRALRGASDPEIRLLAAGVLAALAGHLVDLQFSFDLTISATVFFLLLGLSAALGLGLDQQEPVPVRPSRAALGAAFAVALVVFALLGVRPLGADAQCGRAMRPQPAALRVSAARSAVGLWPGQMEYAKRLAVVLAQSGDFPSAEQVLLRLAQSHPISANLHALLGDFYAEWAGREPRYWSSAEAEYRKAIDLAPNLASYHVGLGAALGVQGRLEEGIGALERAVALDATSGTAYGYLAVLYRAAGRADEARQAEAAAQSLRTP